MSCPQCGAIDDRSHVGVHVSPSYRPGYVVVSAAGVPGITVPADDRDAIADARKAVTDARECGWS